MLSILKREHRESARGLARFRARIPFASGFAFVMAVAMTGFVHARLPASESLERDGAFVPDPAVVERMALGFDAVVADYYWLKAVQAVGGRESVGPEQGPYLGRLVDLVTHLNPHVDHPYRFAAVWLTGSEADVRFANRLLERAIEYHPDDWRNRFYLGFNHFYYLGEHDRAADVLAVAGAMPGAPRHLARLVARLRAESGGLDVAEGLLRELVRETEDEVARTGYLAALDEIDVERKALVLDAARADFQRSRGRDIRKVDELIQSPSPILARLPDAEPASVPKALKRGSIWLVDPDKDAIVSSYYGKRYALHFTSDRDVRVRDWREARVASSMDPEALRP